MIRFKKFLIEKPAYITLTSKKPKDTKSILGTVDDSDYESISKIKGEINSEATENKLNQLLEYNDYQTGLSSSMINIFKKYFTETKHFKLFDDLLANKNVYKIKDTKKINNDSIKNIAGYYNSSYNINEKFFIELANLKSSDNVGTAIGKGEFVIGLFTNYSNATKHGDLKTDKKVPVEVKGPRGRFKGQYAIKPYNKVTTGNRIIEILNTNKDFPQNAGKAMNIIMRSKTLSHTAFMEAKDVIQKLKSAEIKKLIKILIPIENYKYKITSKDVAAFKNSLNNKNTLIAFLLAVHLLVYKEIETFKYLILFKQDYIEYSIINFSKVPNTFADYASALSNYKLTIAGWSDTTREAAFGITIS